MSSKPANDSDPQPAPQALDPLDPCRDILGLPASTPPPHYYALLDIELFCAEPERIESAVRKRFRQVKPYAEHPDRTTRERVQDVMTRIASARVVLTDPKQKLPYDEHLAEALGVDRIALLAARPARRLPDYTLGITAGPRAIGDRFPLFTDQIVTVGSDAACGINLPSRRARPVHARLAWEDPSWTIQAAQDAVVLVNDNRVHSATLDHEAVIDLAGFQLRLNHRDQSSAAHTTQPPPLSLVVRSGPSITEPQFSALPPVRLLVGSCSTATWQLDAASVSKHHARIESKGGLWEITDLKSAAGTQVNGEHVTCTALRHRDMLVIGRFVIQVNLRR